MGEHVIHVLCWVCVECVTYGLNGICRVKGCYSIWVITSVDWVVFPVLYGEYVEFGSIGSIKCGAFKYGVFGVRSFGLFHEKSVFYGVWSRGCVVLRGE